MDIALISPPSRTNTYRLPIGLMYLSACLTQRGISNKIIDPKRDPYALKTIHRELYELKPKYVGVTCLATEIFEVKDLCQHIRWAVPNAQIILGGAHPTYAPEHFKQAEVDYDHIIQGEGDWSLCDFVESSGRINLPQQPDLDLLPNPAYDQVNMAYYASPSIWSIRFMPLSAVGVFASRGCPYKCKFCVAHTVFGRSVRRQSVYLVADHVGRLVKDYRLDGVYFNDECFTLNKKWVEELCGLLKPMKILWGCQTRAQLLDEDTAAAMKQAGCMQIDFGFESGSDRMLKSMNKGSKVQQFQRAVKICKKLKIRILANMMVNLPDETLADIEESKRFIQQAKPNVKFWNVYCPFPGVEYGESMSLQHLKAGANRNLDLLEKHYHFGDYTETLSAILVRVQGGSKIGYLWRFFSFVWQLRYWLIILRSQRKREYISLQWLFKQLTGR